MNATAIIVAAGSGSRFGGAKQFAMLDGKPVYIWSIEIFESVKDVKKIILVLPPESLKEIARRHKKDKKILCVSGGKERFESVAAGLKKLPTESGIVAIHDAARPLLSRRIIRLSLDAAARYGAAVPVIKSGDTIKLTDQDGSFITRTIPRPQARLVQTPQLFRREIILEAYSFLLKEKEQGAVGKDPAATDDSYFAEKLGVKVKAIDGDENNFKITTPEDLLRAELIIKRLRHK